MFCSQNFGFPFSVIAPMPHTHLHLNITILIKRCRNLGAINKAALLGIALEKQ